MDYGQSDIGRIAMIPMITAPISVISSIIILSIILRSRMGLSKLYHRMLFGLSICDILHSVPMCFGTLLMPQDTKFAWKALGNVATCDAQGFIFIVGALGAPLYNLSLSTMYYLSVVHTVRDTVISERYEKYLHAVPILWSLLAATVVLANQSINADVGMCWIQTSPLDCSPTEGDCRGSHVRLLRWVFYGISFILIPFLICYLMFALHQMVITQERRTQRYTFQGAQNQYLSNDNNNTNINPQTSRERKVFIRAMSYVCALFLSYFFGAIYCFFHMYSTYTVKALVAIHYTLYPMQGFYNLIIFLHPQMMKIRSDGGDHISIFKAFLVAIVAKERRESVTNSTLAQRIPMHSPTSQIGERLSNIEEGTE